MSSRGNDNGRDDRTLFKGRMSDAMLRFAPSTVAKQEFGRRLYQAMLVKGWTQSELARKADISRDKVSTYIRGITAPTDQNLMKLADVLNVDPKELLPAAAERAAMTGEPDFEMKRNPGMASHLIWLRINRAVSMKTALKIAELIENDDTTDPSRGGGAASLLAGEN